MRLPGAHAKAGGACHQPSGQNQMSPHQPSMPEDSGAKESLLQGYVHPTGGHNMGVTAEEWRRQAVAGGGHHGLFLPQERGQGDGVLRTS